MMDMKRRLARGVSVLAVALAAGHLVQNMTQEPQAVMATEALPTSIQPVAAGPEKATPKPAIASTMGAETELAALTDEVEPNPPVLPVAPTVAPSAAQTPEPVLDPNQPEVPESGVAAGGADCDVTLDLMEEPNAMIGITLLSPCNPNERIVLRHAGLAIAAKMTATGSLFLSLPALEADAALSILFADGKTVEASIPMPDVAKLRRFGVQWMADDTFQIQALENGATYGAPGNISAANPGKLALAAPQTGGYLSILGDSTVDLPMLAEVYTFPMDQQTPVDVTVEAAVTEKTCGRELLGETITAFGGTVYITDLTLATPECDALGDILVLKNLVPDLKIAAN